MRRERDRERDKEEGEKKNGEEKKSQKTQTKVTAATTATTATNNNNNKRIKDPAAFAGTNKVQSLIMEQKSLTAVPSSIQRKDFYPVVDRYPCV